MVGTLVDLGWLERGVRFLRLVLHLLELVRVRRGRLLEHKCRIHGLSLVSRLLRCRRLHSPVLLLASQLVLIGKLPRHERLLDTLPLTAAVAGGVRHLLILPPQGILIVHRGVELRLRRALRPANLERTALEFRLNGILFVNTAIIVRLFRVELPLLDPRAVRLLARIVVTLFRFAEVVRIVQFVVGLPLHFRRWLLIRRVVYRAGHGHLATGRFGIRLLLV